MTLYHALRFLRILLCAIALIAVVIFTAIAIDERLSLSLKDAPKTFEEVMK